MTIYLESFANNKLFLDKGLGGLERLILGLWLARILSILSLL